MTTADALRQAGAEPLQDDHCLVQCHGQVRVYLQRLLDARSVVVGQAEGASSTQVTALLHVGETSLLIDVPRPAQAEREWLASPLLRFESSLERVAVSFATGPAWPARHGGLPALGLPFPVRLRYQQRREYLRIAPPTGGLRCRLPAPPGNEPRETTVLDIGAGGVALLVREEDLSFAVGDVVEGCTMIGLPRGEPLTVGLLVRHLMPRDSRGAQAWQAGCEFVGLPTAAQDRLFRYVMHLERERMSRRRELE